MPITFTPLFSPRDTPLIPTPIITSRPRVLPGVLWATAAFIFAGGGAAAAPAQIANSGPEIAEALPSAGLPDAPSSVSSSSATASGPSEIFSAPLADDKLPKGRGLLRTAPMGSPTDITVLPGQTAPHQTVRDKMVGSVKDSVSPFTFMGEIISAGYSHVTNGSPNYGTDAPAFGQRVGAAIARGTSQNLFSEGVLASVLHEDPRYYQMGSGQNFFKRVVYAGTRPIITRTDSGHLTPNLALLGGYLGAAALTKTYYPDVNQGFNQTLQTYGGSIGGAALGFVVTEFLSDTLQILHLKKTN